MFLFKYQINREAFGYSYIRVDTPTIDMQRSKLEGKIWMKFVEKSNKREKKMVTFPGPQITGSHSDGIFPLGLDQEQGLRPKL